MSEKAAVIKGHGHVTPNADGYLARCGGPTLCKVCKAELAALKAQPSGVVQWPDADEIMQMAFEEGQPGDDASGYYFELEEFDLFLQRLMEEVARLNSSPVSSGDPEKCSYQDDPRSPAELSLAGCNCVRFGEGNPHWPCKLHTPVSAGGVDERAAFEAWRLEKFCGGIERLKKCSNAPDVYFYTAEQEAWKVWQTRAALSAPSHGEQVERLQMQLVACGVVALANTPESAARARDMHPDYMSASCSDVMRAVDREMHQRADLLDWAVERWHAEVSQRPLVNVNRRSIDDTWRQIIRRLGGDPVDLCGPDHDTLIAAAPSAGSQGGDV